MTADQALDFFADTGVRRRLRASERTCRRLYHARGSRCPRSPAVSGSASSSPPDCTAPARCTSWTKPTTGSAYVGRRGTARLLDRLVGTGNLVVVVEHNLDGGAPRLGDRPRSDGRRRPGDLRRTPRELPTARRSSTAEHPAGGHGRGADGVLSARVPAA
ncbi:hypothetical protein LV779_27940 [Streptomyces thinghirensis]|nr:hypothetical protein [Streptomyces thinghirensis]